MYDERHLRRKLTLKAHGQQVVFVKRKQERLEHVLMKAFLWALYLPSYPELSVEVKIGDRYKPDVVQLDTRGMPVFWGEAGAVSTEKIRSLIRRFPDTHFAMAKWNTALDPFEDIVNEAFADRSHPPRFDLIAFPKDSADRFIDARGNVVINHENATWRRLGGRRMK